MLKQLLKKQMLEMFQNFFVDRKKNKGRSKSSSIMMIVGYAVQHIFGTLSCQGQRSPAVNADPRRLHNGVKTARSLYNGHDLFLACYYSGNRCLSQLCTAQGGLSNRLCAVCYYHFADCYGNLLLARLGGCKN